MKKHLFALIALFGITPGIINGQNVIPDSLFGTNSIYQVITTPGEVGSNFMLQPDGKIIFGGYDYNINQNDFHIDMIRFDHCGIPDTTFGVNGIVRYKFDQRNIGHSFKLQDDGKIVCAGLQAPSNAGSQQISAVSRFNSDGSPDSTFNLTGTHALRYDNVSSGTFHKVYVMNDGRILCIGNCSGNINGGVQGAGAMRFMPDGTLDVTFNGDGKNIFNSPTFASFGKTSGHLLDDGKIILNTFVFDAGFGEHFLAIRFDSTGTLDTTYGTSGYFYDPALVTSNSNIIASEADINGNILLAANETGNTGIKVLRLTPSGVPDNTFGMNGVVNYPVTGFVTKGIYLFANNKILVRGNINNSSVGCGILFLPDGNVDTTFGLNGLRIFDVNNNSGGHSLDALLELPGGKWIAAGSSGDFIFRKYADQSNVPHITQVIDVLSTTGSGSYQWYLNGLPILNANQNTYTFSQNGIYTVMLTDIDGCTYLSDPVNITSSGIPSLSNLSFNVFPNPVSDELHLQNINKLYLDNVKIIDVAGRVIDRLDINQISEQIMIPVRKLSKGVYFLKLTTPDNSFVVRFSKN